MSHPQDGFTGKDAGVGRDHSEGTGEDWGLCRDRNRVGTEGGV